MEEGKEIYSEQLKEGQLKIRHTFELKVGVPVWLYGEVTGKSGLTYRYKLAEMQRPSPNNIRVSAERVEFTDWLGMLQVTAPGGKTIALPVEPF